MAEKIGLSIKSTLKCTVEEYLDRVSAEFQLYMTETNFDNVEYKRLDEYWWKVHDDSSLYRTLAGLAFNVMTLSIANVPAEEGFSVNKDFLDGRVSLSEKPLVSLRLTKDTLQHYGGKVTSYPITRELLSFCSKAYHRYESDLKSKKDAETLERAEKEKKKKELEKQKRKDITELEARKKKKLG